MVSPIPNDAALEEVLREAITSKKLVEGKEAWRLYKSLCGMSGHEDLKEFLYDLKVSSGYHVSLFLEAAEEAGVSVEMNGSIDECSDKIILEGTTITEALTSLRDYEHYCFEFYSTTERALRNSSIDGVDTEAVSAVFHTVATDEKKHVEAFTDYLRDMKGGLKGRGLIRPFAKF